VLKVHRDHKEHKAQQVVKDSKVQQVVVVHRVHKVYRVVKDSKVHKGLLDHRVLKEVKDSKELLDLPDQPDFLDLKGLRDLEVHKVPKVQQEPLGLKDFRVRGVHKGLLPLQDQPEHKVHKEVQDQRVLREVQGLQTKGSRRM
jgi:hypothetical protein